NVGDTRSIWGECDQARAQWKLKSPHRGPSRWFCPPNECGCCSRDQNTCGNPQCCPLDRGSFCDGRRWLTVLLADLFEFPLGITDIPQPVLRILLQTALHQMACPLRKLFPVGFLLQYGGDGI